MAKSAARIEAELQTPELSLQAEKSPNWGARRILRYTDVDLLTPQSIKTLLLNAERGNILYQAELFEMMEERDGELGAHLRTRKNGVTQAETSIDPADNSPEAEQAADLCNAVLVGGEFAGRTYPGLDMKVAMFHLLDAVGKGFSVLEMRWQREADAWWPAELIFRPQRWFTLADDGRTLLVYEATGADGEGKGTTEFNQLSGVAGREMNPLNFIIHRCRSQSGFEWRTGLLRSCMRAFIVRFLSWKDWMAFAEIYGVPMRIGTLRQGVAWDSPEAHEFYDAVRALGTDYAAVVEEGNTIDFPNAGKGEGAIFEKVLERAGRELTLAILGQLLTSGGEKGGSRALGQVQNEIRGDLVDSDAGALQETLTKQLLRPITLLNLGPGYPVPRWNIVVPKPKDLGQLSTVTGNLVNAGLEVPASWAYQTFGIPAPEEGEECLMPASVKYLGGGGDGGNPPGVDNAKAPTAAANSIGAAHVFVRHAIRRAPRRAILTPFEALNAGIELQPEGVIPQDGLDWLGERRVADEAAWNALGPAGRQRVWYVTGLEPDQIAQVAQALMGGLKMGSTANDFLDALEAAGLSVPEGQTPEAGQIPGGQARLVDRQTRYGAFSADRWIKAQRTLARRPYGQYHTAGDERVRPAHAALDGVVKPLDDPFWSSYTPPWDFNCRCTWTTLSPAEMDADGLAETDDAEEAARYQAATMLAGQPYGPDQFGMAVRNLMPVMRRREDVSDLKAPPNPGWQFPRSDAYGLTAQGWQPATEAGRKDMDLVSALPALSEF